MADNTILPLGTQDGDTYASDDISGVKYQRVKVVLGANNSNDGDVSTANPVPVSDAAGSLTVDGTVAATQSGTWTVQPGNTANTTAWKVDGSAVTQPISIAATVTTKESRSATATTSQVADTATNATLLALNTNRLGATIENDSSAVLYVKLGTTATSTDYTVRMAQYAYYEVPFAYTGRIDGIWASDPNDGAARITELT